MSLDVAKGLAIILVVIGHELQYHYGTDVLAFRLIYSFHMPLFMFVAGMVFSLKFHDFPSKNLNISREITKSTFGLLIPFACWTLISAIIRHRDAISQYLLGVVESPDRSLWFLVVLFWCRVFFVMVHTLCGKCFRKPSVALIAAVMAAAYSVIFIASKISLPDNFMGAGAFRGEFPYFALGVFMWQLRGKLVGFLDSIPLNMAMIVMFVIIAPCWYLTSPNPSEAWLAEITGHGQILFKLLKRISPFPGIFLMMSLTRLILRKNFTPLINALNFTGKMTLGIYAVHSYLIGYIPPVILPISGSIILIALVERIPFIRQLLLGK